MNMIHLHLMINHLPIIGIAIGLIVTVVGLFIKNSTVQKVGLWIGLVAGLSAFAAMATGDEAEHALMDGKWCGVDKHDIHEHEEAAELALWPSVVSGLLAAVALWGLWKGRQIAKYAVIMYILGAAGSLTLMYRTGTTGGAIRHPELENCCSAEAGHESCSGENAAGCCSGTNHASECPFDENGKCIGDSTKCEKGSACCHASGEEHED